MVACKAAFYTFQLYITSEVNSTTRRFFYHTLQTLDRMQFFIILQKKNCTHSIFWTIEARASFAQNIKELTTLENVFRKTDSIMSRLAVTTICSYVVYKVIMGF